MNIYHIAIYKKGAEHSLPFDWRAVIADRIIDIHGAKNMDKVFRMLQSGETSSEVKANICPECLNFKDQCKGVHV